jgi:hypothetical protein
MTITTDDTRSILTCCDPVRADTQQAWDLAIGDDPAGIAVAEFADDDAADGVAGARGRVAAQGTGRNTAMLGAGGGPAAFEGLARWAAGRDPAGWVERRVSIPADDEETRRRKALFTLALILVIPFGVVWAGLYFVYGEPLSALASMSYVVVTIAGIVLLFRFRNFALFCWTELALAFPVPVVQQLLLTPAQLADLTSSLPRRTSRCSCRGWRGPVRPTTSWPRSVRGLGGSPRSWAPCGRMPTWIRPRSRRWT